MSAPGSTIDRPARRDVLVIGGGSVGLVAAIALAQAGFDTGLIGTVAASKAGRTVALLEGSVRLLETLGLWSDLRRHAQPLATMKIVDATPSLFRPPPVAFVAAEIGRRAFGYNVPNDALESLLWTAAGRTPGLAIIAAQATGFEYRDQSVWVNAGPLGSHKAALVVGADGRESLARKAAGIGVRRRAWPQVALTATLSHQVPHENVSAEFHTRHGPLTLVPLRPTPAAPCRSSLVWVMSPGEAQRRRALTPADFATEVGRQASNLFGAMTLDGPVGAFPIETSLSTRLTGRRLVLTGEAAHALPPIGAQGLNLSFRDIDALAACLRDARSRGADIGGAETIGAYAASRRGDVGLRTAAVNALNASLLARSPASDLMRGVGLTVLGAIGPLRRAVMREGLVPQGSARDPAPAGLDGHARHRRSTALP